MDTWVIRIHILKQGFLYSILSHFRKYAITIIIITVLVITETSTPLWVNAVRARDYWPTENWETSTPEEKGMKSTKLQEMMNYISSNNIPIDGLVIIKNGYLVYEIYPNPSNNTSNTHLLYSVTKSVTSCLIGIAIDKGYIKGTDESMLSFFPNTTIKNLDDRKRRITLEDLLTMRSGLSWDESSAPFNSPYNDIYYINNGDGLTYCLGLPMVAEPGSLWHYNTGASHILSGIITKATNMSTLSFAINQLFEPLGITKATWGKDKGGTYKGGFDLQLSPRDMAKFGFLYLNKGFWESKQIVSSNWVERSTSTITRTGPDTGYGYQWWTTPNSNIISARGLYGQFIFISPERDLVVSVTANLNQNMSDVPLILFNNYILSSMSENNDETKMLFYLYSAVIISITSLILIIKRWKSNTI